jgi:hypothetical protein
MKRIPILLSLGLAVRVAAAAPADHAASDEKDRASPFADRTSSPPEFHDGGVALGGSRVMAEVVSVDRSENTITVRPTGPAAGDTRRTLPVQGAATAGLEDLAAGDTVALSCRGPAEPDGALALGDCTAVTSIGRSGSRASDFSGAPALSTAKTFTAVVVFADAGAQTLTVKDPARLAAPREALTLSVDAKAASALRNLKSGQEVRITCREASPNATTASFGISQSVSDCSSVTSVGKVTPDSR